MEVKVGKVYWKSGVEGKYIVILAVGYNTETCNKELNKQDKKIVIFRNLKDGKVYSMDYEEFVKPVCDVDGNVIVYTAELIRDELAIAKGIITKKELKCFRKVAEILKVYENISNYTL